MQKVNSQWITIVLITAVIMLVFLVFYGNKAPMHPTSPPIPQQTNPNEVKSEPTPPVAS